jgi:hypothetical protein
MSTKYWDLYVYYVKKCERENYENDIDPAHYQMEFNHFWPKCIFGEWPVGQWLTLKQHAIATALQTLVFKRNCMFSTHKSYLPPRLLELAWPYFREACRTNALKINNEERQKYLSKGRQKLHAEKDENGLSAFAVEKCGSPRKGISVVYPDNSIKIFRSISEASRFLGVKRDKIKNVMNGISARWGKLYGLRFELAE